MRLLTIINDLPTRGGGNPLCKKRSRSLGRRLCCQKLERKCHRKYNGLKKKTRGSIVEQGLIIATIIIAAIIGLGYLGLAVRNQLGILIGINEYGSDTIESSGAEDLPNFSEAYYHAKNELQQIAAQQLLSDAKMEALYGKMYEIIWNYSGLSYNDLYYLGLYMIDLHEDHQDASEAYKEYKKALIAIYHNAYGSNNGGNIHNCNIYYRPLVEERELGYFNSRLGNIFYQIFEVCGNRGLTPSAQ